MKRGSVEGRTVFDFFAPAIAAKFDHDDHAVIQRGEPLLAQQEQSLSLAGEQREIWLETNKVPLRDTDGKIVGLVGISSDISARKAGRGEAAAFRRSARALQCGAAKFRLRGFARSAGAAAENPGVQRPAQGEVRRRRSGSRGAITWRGCKMRPSGCRC